MKLKNYTSGQSVEKSIIAIETLLVQAGAQTISKFYEGERIAGFFFQIPVNATNMPVSFKLPVSTIAVQRVMEAEIKRARRDTYKRVQEQAERTAWALLREWVHVQLSMVQMQQAEALQIFLPYAYDGTNDQTFFEKLKGNGFKQLSQASEKS